MMKKYIASLLVGVGLVTLTGAATPAFAALDPFGGDACKNNPKSSVCDATKKKNQNNLINNDISNIVNILLFAVGIIAVLVIIVGGIMYTVSGGDSGRIKTAKDTILYAVIGLVIAISAYAIVNFVVARLT